MYFIVCKVRKGYYRFLSRVLKVLGKVRIKRRQAHKRHGLVNILFARPQSIFLNTHDNGLVQWLQQRTGALSNDRMGE
jgi:hypothetical protein